MIDGNKRARQYKFFGFIVALYVAMQLISDVTAGKLVSVLGFPVSVTVLYFPVTYIFADVLTEVYGYAMARRALWTVLLCSILAGLVYQLVVYLPPAEGFDGDDAYRRVFGIVPRVLVGGWIAVFAGDILNNYVMAKLKVVFDGRLLWVRTISSTIVGQFVNTVLFYGIALSGVIPTDVLIEAVITGWVMKTVIEALMTPVTYAVVARLKKVEEEDYFDRETNFNPFKL